jgi:hypothetical protein
MAGTSIEWAIVRLGDKLYVPDVSALRSRVLYELHDAPTAGHHGITQILAVVTWTFWWPNMKRIVQHNVRSCLPANVTRQRDTSPMLDSLNRTRYVPCPSNTYRLTCLRTFPSAMGMMLWWHLSVCLRNARLSSRFQKQLQRSN